MGYINNPKKAIYNKIYNKTSRSIFDDINSKSNNSYNINAKNDNNPSCSMYEAVKKIKFALVLRTTLLVLYEDLQYFIL